jgi:VWFA-related protein
MRKISRLCLVLLSCALPAIAQQSVPATEPATKLDAPALARNDRHIQLDLIVTDKSGRQIPGLQQQDFTLLDNKLPQKILSFAEVGASPAAPEPPSEVVLLIDTVNTSFQSVSYERSQVEGFLKQNGGKLAHPTSIIFFADLNTQVQTVPTRDGNALVADFEKNETALRTIRRSQGFYGAVERLDLSLRTLGTLAAYESRRPGRKLLVWISPGWPMLSGPRIDLSNKEQQDLFQSVVSMSTALRQARITLYGIDPLGTADAGGGRTFYYESFLKGVRKANDVAAGNLALQVLAVQSGGRVFNSTNDLTGAVESCATDASNYYVLTFDAPPAEHPNEYHGIEVKTDKPGLTVRTRTGYYAQP